MTARGKLSAIFLLVAMTACERATPSQPIASPRPPAPAVTATAKPPVLDAGADPVPEASAAVPDVVHAVDAKRLAALVEEARATDSDALLVLQDGKLVAEHYFSKRRDPVQTMSITKSVLALTVGCLLAEGKLTTERTLSEFYPKLKGDPRGAITVEHLLTHTSGLDEGKSTAQIYAAKSFVDQALGSALLHAPGTHYEYGNRASNLLAGVIAIAGGEPTQAVTRRCVLEPLGIKRWHWSKDPSGQVHGMAGLHLLPRDLAKLGQLVLDRGTFGDRRVVPAEWIDHLTTPAPVQPHAKPLARLWWLVPEWSERSVDAALLDQWRAAGVDAELVTQLAPLVGRRFRSTLDWSRALEERAGDPELRVVKREIYERGLPDARMAFGATVGHYAHGSLGQFVVVVPRDRLVAVRTRRSPRRAKEKTAIFPSFPDFPQRIVALTGRSIPGGA